MRKSLSRKRTVKEEEKLRFALDQGVSAMELWKLVGDDSCVQNPLQKMQSQTADNINQSVAYLRVSISQDNISSPSGESVIHKS